jgi:hypothetical protein
VMSQIISKGTAHLVREKWVRSSRKERRT